MSNLLRKRINRGLRVARRQDGKGTGIDDSKIFDANDASCISLVFIGGENGNEHTMRINNCHRIILFPHLVRTGSMMDSRRTSLDDMQNILVVGNVRTRESLLALENGFYRRRLPGIAGLLESCHGDFLVTRISEPCRVDEGVVPRVVRGNRDIAARKRRDGGDADGCKVVCARSAEHEIIQ